MRKTIKAIALTFALAIPVCAGDIGQPRVSTPDQQQPQTTSESAKTGDIGCPIAESDIAMTLLRTLLVLF